MTPAQAQLWLEAARGQRGYRPATTPLTIEMWVRVGNVEQCEPISSLAPSHLEQLHARLCAQLLAACPQA